MCFELYAGTSKPIARREFDQSAPALSVVSLAEEQGQIRAHFRTAEEQYIGSTSNCGCDFPHLIFQNGSWPAPLEKDPERAASHQFNQEALVSVLKETGENTIELYGVWNGDVSEPLAREQISIEDLLDPAFYFKEQGFYEVKL